MPEALARSDFDFIVRERAGDPRPRSRGGEARPKSFAPKKGQIAVGFFAKHVQAHPMRAAKYAGIMLMAAAILVNALALQNGHRAEILLPLFSAQPMAKAPTLSPKNNAKFPRLSELVPLPPNPLAAQAHPTARPSGGHETDAIAALLQPNAADKSITMASIADTNVAFVQRALALLGYSLRADGVFGRTTRLAIARFQRSEGLAQTGDISLKLRERLAARSGLQLR